MVLFVFSALSTPVLVGRYVVTQLLGAALLLGAASEFLTGLLASRRLGRGAVTAVLIVIVLGASFEACACPPLDGGCRDSYRSLADALTSQAEWVTS